MSSHDQLPEYLANSIKARKAVAQTVFPDKRPAAFFDFDGSLIDGDMTEGKRSGANPYAGLVDRAILDGFFAEFKGEEGRRQFWQVYDGGFNNSEEAYAWVDILVSAQKNLLQEYIAGHIKEIVERSLFAFARQLLNFCDHEEIEPFIISASPHVFVKELYSCLAFKRENLFGFCVDNTVHNAQGKESRLNELCESRELFPALALGNKWQWDGLMLRRACEEGGVGILVNESEPKDFAHPSLYCFDIR